MINTDSMMSAACRACGREFTLAALDDSMHCTDCLNRAPTNGDDWRTRMAQVVHEAERQETIEHRVRDVTSRRRVVDGAKLRADLNDPRKRKYVYMQCVCEYVQGRLTNIEWVVLMTLASACRTTDLCNSFPSMSWLAGCCGHLPRTITATIRKLERKDFLIVHNRVRLDGGASSHGYEFRFPAGMLPDGREWTMPEPPTFPKHTNTIPADELSVGEEPK